MTITEKVAYLKGLADGLAIDTEKSKEGKLISVIIDILEEMGMSIEDLEENTTALGEELDAVSDDLAVSVEHVGLSVTGNGYTLTIEDMLVDENGCGVASFTLENPEGIRNNPEYGLPGELVPDDDAPLDALGMSATGEGTSTLLDYKWIYDQELSTDTLARGTVYFSAFGNLDAAVG